MEGDNARVKRSERGSYRERENPRETGEAPGGEGRMWEEMRDVRRNKI